MCLVCTYFICSIYCISVSSGHVKFFLRNTPHFQLLFYYMSCNFQERNFTSLFKHFTFQTTKTRWVLHKLWSCSINFVPRRRDSFLWKVIKSNNLISQFQNKTTLNHESTNSCHIVKAALTRYIQKRICIVYMQLGSWSQLETTVHRNIFCNVK